MAVRQREGEAVPVAFEELWTHRERVRAVCLGIVRDQATAEDLVQDTYLRALTTVHPPDRRGPLGAWLSVVARHRAIDRLRADRHERASEAVSVLAGPPVDPADEMLGEERRKRVRRALAELRPRERRVLVQHVVDGLSVTELATREGTTETAVRSTLWRARRKLRAVVDRGGPLGAVPGPRLSGAWRRFRQECFRVEAHGAALFTGIAVHLLETTATALVAVLLLASPSATTVEDGLRRASEQTAAPHLPMSTARPDVRLGGRLEVADLGVPRVTGPASVPPARLTVGTEIGEWGGQVSLESDSDGPATTIDITFEVSVPSTSFSRYVVVTCDSSYNPPAALKDVEMPVDPCLPFAKTTDVIAQLPAQ